MSQKGFTSLSILLGILVTAILVAVLLLSYRVSYNQTESPIDQNYPSPSPRIGRYGQPILYPNPVAMKVVDLNFEWADSRSPEKDKYGFDQSFGNVVIKVKRAYLTPHTVYNFFPSNTQAGLNAESFLIIETNIRDLRTKGNPRDIKGDQYFRIRKDGKDTTPIDGFSGFKPQENQDVNAVFAVPKSETSFTLIAGPLVSPRIVNIDFGGPNAQSVIGVYDWPLGFFDKLP